MDNSEIKISTTTSTGYTYITNDPLREIVWNPPVQVRTVSNKETHSELVSKSKGLTLNVYKNEDDMCIAHYDIMPDITKVETHNNRVIIVHFSDNTKEKAVVSADDKFSFEQGVSICITKKLLSQITGGRGSSTYNKLIRRCNQVYKANLKAEEYKKKCIDESKEIARRRREKSERHKAKREREKMLQFAGVIREVLKGYERE